MKSTRQIQGRTGTAEATDLAVPEGWRGLERALLEYITARRWFRGKARRPMAATVQDVVPLSFAGPSAALLVVQVEYQAGKPETYAVPVVRNREKEDAAGADGNHIIGRVRGEDGRGETVLDALSDMVFCRGLLETVGKEQTFPGAQGKLTTTPTAAYRRVMDLPPAELEPVPVSSEQSNTSVVFEKQAVLKLYRLIGEGINPEVEAGRFLTERTGFGNIARVAGSIEYRQGRKKPASLAVLHQYVRNEGDAWKYTLEQLDEFYRRVKDKEFAGGEAADSDIGGYMDSARLLGRRTGELHIALASSKDDPAFAPEPFSADYREMLYRTMRKNAVNALQLLHERFDNLPETFHAEAQNLLDSREAVLDRFHVLKHLESKAARIRCHGDYHLGQVLYTGKDFVILDFEGEPARSLAERRTKTSPLKDAAGMMRSFHYAARTGLVEKAGEKPGTETAENLRNWGRYWYERVSAAFLDTYKETMHDSGLLPEDAVEFKTILDAFLLDKALYELAYELNNRPDWAGVPLRGILDLLQTQAAVPVEKTVPEKEAGMRYDITLFSGDDLYLFNEGTHYRLYEKLGAHPMTLEGVTGTYFAVWAPNARSVSVIGDFNGWNNASHYLSQRGSSGIWEGFAPGVMEGEVYKYHIVSHHRGYQVDKADPFAFYAEMPPKTASVVRELTYEWDDGEWMEKRRNSNALKEPMSIYEIHPGSWQRVPEEGHRYLTYRELAPRLANYMHEMGYTHVEFMPLMEHPFYGSWGYQTTGYFSPTSRFGTPQDLMFMVDYLHREGIGVILDWVPSHFPNDEHGLAYFDGTHLYEHEDPRQRVHPDWDSYIFNYSRNEVRSFLTSSAMFWLDRYHADGLRVDAVASMLYLDYGRRQGDWVPNRFGGRENLDAINFLKQMNQEAYSAFPGIQTIAEESTAWPMVSRPTYLGGLGFGLKWDMGWMHDTLQYMSKDPIFRKYHHNNLTFRMIYAFYENYILPLSHDEVVHGKGSLLGKMPGDDWQKFANLRALFGYMYAQPGKKLLFMGGEIGQWREWNHEESLDWHLLQYEPHAGLHTWLKDLNALYRHESALYELDTDPAGFRWIDCCDVEHSVVSLIRKGQADDNMVVVACNFTPETLFDYRIGLPLPGTWREALNSDNRRYYGSGQVNPEFMDAENIPWHGYAQSVSITLPPLGVVFFTRPV